MENRPVPFCRAVSCAPASARLLCSASISSLFQAPVPHTHLSLWLIRCLPACLDFVTLLRTLQSSVVKTWGLACAQVPPGGTSCQEPKRCCKLPVRELFRLFFSLGQDRVAGSALKSEGVLYFFKIDIAFYLFIENSMHAHSMF